ncbi:MarR family transcriptional regulator [Alginatibacterium sediminis]|uniref:MarR family transcriptional regulator n=1 Tax=Alginatibacterium sediminis TaxID=2164068 RepID=A0A420E7L5_9ALTE|nr:MarR family transcriptional regulator [Alginatibacterium sediminis]RKF13712.1 MarR family transcriptional regulator [Alginatibacterium sediminis]
MVSQTNLPNNIPRIEVLEQSHFFAMTVITRLHRTACQERLRPHYDITLEMLLAMNIIEVYQPIPQQQLANQLMCDRSAAKRSVDHLVKRGWVDVSKNETNQKLKMISLNASGTEVIAKCMPIMRETYSDFMDSLEPDEQTELLRLCKKMISANTDQA